MPNATSTSRFGPLTASDVARVQAEVAKAAKAAQDANRTPADDAAWRSWCRIAFALQEARRDG